MINSIKYEILSNDYKEYDLSFKAVFVGDPGSGRSVLLNKLNSKNYDRFIPATNGFDFYIFNIKLEDKIIRLQLWDCTGLKIYRSLLSNFYRDANLIAISYAINDRTSFVHIESWLNQAKTNTPYDCKFFLIGNKADDDEGREVLKEEGEKIAKNYNFDYLLKLLPK